MKKITFFISLFSLMMGMQQTSAQTYDLIASFAGTGLEGDFGGTSAMYATNPVGTDQVIKLTSNAGQIWQGLNVNLATNYRLTAATQLSMQLDVYSTTAITIAPKAQGGLTGAPESVTTATHNGSGWQTLTFTFNQSLDGKVPANGDYSDFALHINWNIATNTFGTPDGRIFYIKNLKGLSVAPPPTPTAPTVAAPTPPSRPVGEFISLFSNVYTNIGVTEWSTSWDDAVISDLVSVVGDDIKKITFGNFLGVQFTNYENATNMTHFHMDYYIPAGTDLVGKVLNPKWSNHAATAGETNALLLTNLPTTAGSWVSVDVPLSSFTAQGPGTAYAREKLYQFLLTSNLGVVYVDNIYLHKNTVLSSDSFAVSNVKLYPNPTSNILNIESVGTIQNIAIINVLGQEVMNKTANESLLSLDVSGLNAGVYVIKTVIDGTVSSTKFIKE